MYLPKNFLPDDVWRAFEQIQAIATGRFLLQRTVKAATTALAHGLRSRGNPRSPIGWIELSPGSVVVNRSTGPTGLRFDDTNIYVIAASQITADLYVF